MIRRSLGRFYDCRWFMGREIASIDGFRYSNAWLIDDRQYCLRTISPLGGLRAATLTTWRMRSRLPPPRSRRGDGFTTFAKNRRCRNWNGKRELQEVRIGRGDSLSC